MKTIKLTWIMFFSYFFAYTLGSDRIINNRGLYRSLENCENEEGVPLSINENYSFCQVLAEY
jgi:hypothetical protein